MVRIYLLWNEVGEYVGSTARELEGDWTCRLAQHKQAARRPNFKCSSNILFADGRDANIELLEECPDELRYERERYWALQFPDRVNIQLPARDKKAWFKEWGASKVECPHCSIPQRRDSFRRHIRRKHPSVEK